MKFSEVVDQARALLQSKGRMTYRALKREFALDDEALADLKEELIEADRVAVDEHGKILVWAGTPSVQSSELKVLGSPQPLALSIQHAPGERRQLTVQFIDLVGSTMLSQQLDPEDYHARVVAYQAACRQIIARYDGHIAQYLGDGVLVYFGYPAAHDEDAVRAVRSGLDIVAAVGQLEFTSPLQVRIGIHTGPVVVGEIGAGERTEWLALGETPNIAARVQGQATPNTVVISVATHRLVEGLFECHELGPQALKGLSAPLALYRVGGESTAQSRFEAAVHKGLTPLVGRAEELALLQRRWEQTQAGAGQVVLLSGEAGIGKSRLVQELKEHISAEGATRLEFRCSPYHQNSALYPIIEHLQRLLQFAREDAPATKLEKLQCTLSHYRFPQADTFSLLAALLSLPPPLGAPPLTGSAQKQKEKTQEALVAWLVEEAEKAAVYCAWEDLHWADPSTLEVLTLILDQTPTTRLMALLTFRPEFTSPWGNRSHLSQLTLSRLGRSQVEAMVEKVTGRKTLPSEVLQQIVAKTDGVPLFVEEVTKTVLESGLLREEGGRYVGVHGGAPISPLAIPSTLQDSLMARLDRLSTVRELAQLGATLGREFSYELIRAVSRLDEERLQQGLKQLAAAELVYQRGLGLQAHYLFKHALIQDTAYQSLLKSRRQQLHRQIAQVLEERFPDTKEAQPELLAHHYTAANLLEQAIPYWQQAGERASQRSANAEAVAHLTTGLELLKTRPDTPEYVQQELTLQLALSTALMAVKGFAAPEVEKAVTRARDLCQQLDESPQLFPVLGSLYAFYQNRGELQTTREVAEQMMRLAESIQGRNLLSMAHMALGGTLYWLGELTLARPHQEQAIALYDPQPNPRPSTVVNDPRVISLYYAAVTLWHLGYPDQALKSSHEAVALAAGLSRPFTLAQALGFAAPLHAFRREWQIARERAEAVMTLSTEQGFPFWLAQGTIARGGALVELGQEEEGLTQMQQGLAAFRAMGAELARTAILHVLAEAYAKVGRIEEGLSVVAEALAFVDKTGMRFIEAELYRIKGELTLQSQVKSHKSKVEEAEEYFLKAIEIARKQQAKSWELRAVMSLSHLWQSQGKKNEAWQMLAEIYNWFTEGFDTKDLQEAKALLDSLESGV